MPLRELVHTIAPPPPPEVVAAADDLHYRDYLTVALVVPESRSFPDNWIYIHATDVEVGRIQNYGSWSPYLVKDGRTCLGLEYFVFEGDDMWNTPDDELIALGTTELIALGLAAPGDVEHGYVVRVPKAYPYYDFAYKDNVATIRAWLEANAPNVHPVGRNGMHKYNNQDHSMYTAMLTVENMYGASTTSGRSTSKRSTTKRARPDATPRCCRGARPPRRAPATLADQAPAGAMRWRPWMTLVGAGAAYLVVGFVLWVHAWVEGASTHTLCGCGDPALFLWFFQWPATALAHGENPFYSTALFHPTGINLLAQTSVTGLSLPLVPVTWIWGPVASLNVASTLTPAITAFTAFVVMRRWVSWTPAAFLGGLLYGFSPFVLTSLEFAHLMTAALMLLPLILAVLDEIVVRQRHSPVWAGVVLGLLVFAQFFLSSELLAITALVAAVCLVALVIAALAADRDTVRRLAPHAAKGLAVGLVVGGVLLAWPVWFALEGPAHLSGLVWPNVGVIGGFIPSSYVSAGYPNPHNVFMTLGGYEGAPLASAGYLGWGFVAVLLGGIVAFRRDRRLWFFGFVLFLCVACSLGERHGQWEPAWVFTKLPLIENVIEQRFMAIGFLAAAIMLAIVLECIHRVLPDWRGIDGRGRGGLCRPRAHDGDVRHPSPLRHAAGDPAPLVHRGGADAAPRTRAALVSGAVLGDPVGDGVAGGQPHALQPGRRGRAAGSAAAGGIGGPRVRGSRPPGVRGRRPRTDRDPGRVRRRAPRAGRVARHHGGHRHQSGRSPDSAGSRPHVCGGLHDGHPGTPPPPAGGGLGVGRRAGRAAGPPPPGARARSKHVSRRPRAARSRSWPACGRRIASR